MTDSQDGFRDLSAIGDTFKTSVGHMKGGFPVWEEFVARGVKFQKHFEQTIVSFNGFIDSLYKIAEVAHNTKGGTHEIGAGLINLAMWHRGQEMKLKEMNQALMKKLLAPLQVKVEEWKKNTSALEREHDKELQKSIRDIKESAKNTIKTSKSLESKMKKDRTSDKASALHQQLEHFQQETDRRLKDTEDRERKNLNRVLLEERSWFCGFVNAFTSVLDVEAGMLMDLERLQAILKDLSNEVSRPTILPETTRGLLENWTIPASPATLHRKITNAPSMLSVSSNSSGDSSGPVISGPVITGPVIAGSMISGPTLVSGPAISGALIHPPHTTGGGNFPPPPPVPVAPIVPGHTAGGGVSFPPPPPMNMPPAFVPSAVAPPQPPGVPRPPPPTSLPPSSCPNISQVSHTLPRNYRSGSAGEGGGVPNSANFLQGFPPQHNFLPPQGGGGGVQYTTNGDNIQNRSLPPVPPYHSDPHYPSAPGISTSPSRASFASNQSAESSRSLSPPDGPCTGPPPIPQTHPNTSVVVAGNGTAPEQDNPSSFQEQLMSRIRLRSLSNEVPTASSSLARSQENIYSLPAFTTPPLPRASNSMSASASARTGPPPVSSKPARPPTVASKPSRAGYLQTANGHGPPLHSTRAMSFDTHMASLPRSVPQNLDLDPEEDNMFARALRERKLRNVQTNDRSDPVIGR